MADLKTFNGLARANVKTFNGLASASWKTWNGLNTVTGGSGPAYIASTAAGARSTFSTTGIDTTGATLLVIGLGWFGGVAEPTITDSNGNTWISLTLNTSGYPYTRFRYCLSPTVGSGHTVTVTGNDKFGAVSFAAFSGITAYDSVQNSAYTAGATSLSSGSVTPSQNNSLIVTHLALAGNAQTPTINLSFTASAHKDAVSGTNYGADLAYLVLGTAAATNPTWSWTTSIAASNVIAVFR